MRIDLTRPALLGVFVALLFALAARLPYLLASDFPVNDGGLFYSMSREILEGHFSLPSFTSYNFESIPFAYPPLSFYLAAAVTRVTGMELITVIRFLPLVANLAIVVALFFLARSLIGAGRAALIAPTVFAVIPRSYEWMIMGGGLTRSVGFLFAVVCLSRAKGLYTNPSPRRIAVCGALAAAAFTSHIEMGIFVSCSLLLMAILHGRSLRALLIACALVLLMVGLAAPWWATVVSRHGVYPFDAARLTSDWSSVVQDLAALERYIFPSGLLLSTLGVAAVLGMITCIIRGELFLPLWLPSIFIAVPRSAQSEGAIPLAILAALGIIEVVLPGLLRVVNQTRTVSVSTAVESLLPGLPNPGVVWHAWDMLGMVLLLGTVSLYNSPSSQGSGYARYSLDSLPVADREAMKWVSENTPQNAQFLVLSGSWSWEVDHVGEWFPVIAGRRSVLTPQGSEWLPSETFARQKCLFYDVRSLSSSAGSMEQLDRWAQDRGVSFSYIYISREVRGPTNWDRFLASAMSSPDYRVLINSPSVAVLERKEPLKPLSAPPGQLLVSSDCQSLADQSPTIQQVFQAAYGQQAAWAWLTEHQRAIGGPVTICGQLSQSELSQLAPVKWACRSPNDVEMQPVGAADGRVLGPQLAHQRSDQVQGKAGGQLDR